MAPPLKPKGFQERNTDNSALSSKPLVILAKPPDKNKVSEIQTQNTPSSPTGQNELKPPMVLQKTRDGIEQDGSRSTSPGIASPSMSQTASGSVKDSEAFADFVKNVSQKVYHIQQKPSSLTGSDGDQKLLPTPEMAAPVKLIDESQQWCESALEFLHDGNDFYVIGILGLQGTGKSTVLSAINGWPVFKIQNPTQKEVGEHCTSGIDVFVTNQRIILLDTQPLLSASVMDQMIQFDKKKFFESEKKPLGSSDYYSAESTLYIQVSMQQVAFLMSVCHTIITVQDWFIDLNYIRFLLSCEMLKPAKPMYSHELKPVHEASAEYYPNLVFVQNKCTQYEFSAASMAKMKKTLYLLFLSSNLNFCDADEVNNEEQSVNLFLLPLTKEENENEGFEMGRLPEYKGHPSFQSMTKSLSQQILSMPRQMMTHTATSEKNWFHYSARIWDTIKKINVFDEYRRHIVSIP